MKLASILKDFLKAEISGLWFVGRGSYTLEVERLFIVMVLPKRPLFLVGIHNQQFQGTIIFMVFDLPGYTFESMKKLNGTESQQTPFGKLPCRAIRYSALFFFGVRNPWVLLEISDCGGSLSIHIENRL